MALGVDPARIHKTLIAAARRSAGRRGRARGGRAGPQAAGRCARRPEGRDGRPGRGRARHRLRLRRDQPDRPRRQLPVVDDAALELSTIFVSAGRRGLQVELAPADLVRLCPGLSAPSRGSMVGRHGLDPAGILCRRPQATPPDRQAQTEDAAPHGRTLSSVGPPGLFAPRTGPPGPAPRSAAPARPISARRIRASPSCRRRPTHRHACPRAVFRRRGGKSVAVPQRGRPEGVSPWSFRLALHLSLAALPRRAGRPGDRPETAAAAA